MAIGSAMKEETDGEDEGLAKSERGRVKGGRWHERVGGRVRSTRGRQVFKLHASTNVEGRARSLL